MHLNDKLSLFRAEQDYARFKWFLNKNNLSTILLLFAKTLSFYSEPFIRHVNFNFTLCSEIVLTCAHAHFKGSVYNQLLNKSDMYYTFSECARLNSSFKTIFSFLRQSICFFNTFLLFSTQNLIMLKFLDSAPMQN